MYFVKDVKLKQSLYFSAAVVISRPPSVAGSNIARTIPLINMLNVTGVICADGWDHIDATAYCKESGYQRGEASVHKLHEVREYVNNPVIWLTHTNCNHNDTTLRTCQLTVGKQPVIASGPCLNGIAGATCFLQTV